MSEKLGDFEEGARVRLMDDVPEECDGTVVGFVVKEVRVRFDDGETITFDVEDRGFERITRARNGP